MSRDYVGLGTQRGRDIIAAINRLNQTSCPHGELSPAYCQLCKSALPLMADDVAREREEDRRLREVEERVNLLNEQETGDFIPDAG